MATSGSNDYDEKCRRFLDKYHSPEFSAILECNEHKDYLVIHVGFMQLLEEEPELGNGLINNPQIVLNSFKSAAALVLAEKCEDLQNHQSLSSADFGIEDMKKKLRVRIDSVPEYLTRKKFQGVKDVGKFVAFVGTVTRTTQAKVCEYAKLYECTKCHATSFVTAPDSRYHVFPKFGSECTRCHNSKTIPKLYEPGERSLSKFKDFQEVKIQEQVQRMDFGTIPQIMCVVLEDDLVDSLKPGDDVTICGYVYTRWKPFKVGQQVECEVTLKANHVQVDNEMRSSASITKATTQFAEEFWKKYESNPFLGRNTIISSFCPQIYGMYVVKLALFTVMIGGVAKEISGSQIRGDAHMLMVGDPGTGKSQMLKYASMLSIRSVMTTGMGTTNAGLTVSAVKDGNDWVLEAGALVLADGGICCIDEFSRMKIADRASLHEAMEQQTISVAKAGIVSKLSTRCSILAATNPNGKYNPNSSLQVNTGLDSPLLSRFDLIIVLTDAQNQAWDSLLADFILEGKHPHSCPVSGSSEKQWDFEQMQSYLILIKDLQPQMSKEATEVISKYYLFARNKSVGHEAQASVRLLESLRRLAEGHAKLMFREWVLLHDAITAIALVESSMLSADLVPSANSLHSSFPTDAKDEYKTQAKIVLEKLELHNLWEEEKIYLENLGQTTKDDSPPSASVPTTTQATQISDRKESDDNDVGPSSKYFKSAENDNDEDIFFSSWSDSS